MSNTQQKVVMIGWEYPPNNSGGLGVACQGMTQALAQANSQVYFTLPYAHAGADHMQIINCASPDWLDTTQPPFMAYAGATLSPLSLKINHHDLARLSQDSIHQQISAYADTVTTQVNAKVNDFNVIHAHDWMAFPVAAALKQTTGKPVIAHIHSTEIDRSGLGTGNLAIVQTERQGMLMADQIVAVSEYTKRLLIKEYGMEPNKITVVHNGIAPVAVTNFQYPTMIGNRPVIVFMGRLTIQKGIQHFLELADKVLKVRPEALFVIAGSGDMYHELLFTTAYKKLSAHVLFSGFLRDTQKNWLLDRADVFVMPSLSEPFGLVALEAAQHQTPVIISKNSGVAEVLPSAIQVDFWDINQMAQEILQLIGQPQVKGLQVAQQVQDLTNVSWKNAAQKLQQVYIHAMNGS